MANIMQMFRAKNKVSRDGYDLSKKLAFTAQAGELLPVYSRILMPGDKFEMGCRWKTRTAPVNTAAFTRFREYYDWYFVPLQLLWDKYHTWSTNMKDNNQVATSIKGTTLLTDKHPYFTTQQIANYLYEIHISDDISPTIGHNQFGFQRSALTCKLLHYLGYGDFYNYEDDNDKFYNLELSPWRLLAYQKIYQDYHRHSQWESSAPQTCNINYISGADGDLNIPIQALEATDNTMFDLRYSNWNKDLFTGLLPNSQFGDAASINLDGLTDISLPYGVPTNYRNLFYVEKNDGSVFDGNLNIVTSHEDTYVGKNALKAGDSYVSQYFTTNAISHLRDSLGIPNSINIQTALQSQFTVLAIRQAEALQKWKEITESNSKDFPSQIEAHYGVKPSNAYSQRCQYLGGYDGTIDIQDVDNTNITENADGTFNAADIAGKGINRGQGSVKNFSTDVPGVLMCIYHVQPLIDYALGNVAMDNMKTLFTDYAIPEFDKTGMMQVPLAAFTNKKSDISEDTTSEFDLGNGLLGYAPNYIDYKTDIDEVKGAFYNGGLESWVAPVTDSYVRQWFGGGISGPTEWRGLDWKFFKVNPSITNAIFAQDANSFVESDKFWVNCMFDIKAVRPLDAQGLPY